MTPEEAFAELVEAATAVWLERAAAQVIGPPEEHCAAIVEAVIAKHQVVLRAIRAELRSWWYEQRNDAGGVRCYHAEHEFCFVDIHDTMTPLYAVPSLAIRKGS